MLYSNTSQSRLNFDIEKLRLLGVNEIFAFPGYGTDGWFQDIKTLRKHLSELSSKRDEVCKKYPDITIGIMAYTYSHPEGTNVVPAKFKTQIALNGRILDGFVCPMDDSYRDELLKRFSIIAEFGFRKVLLDDDFKDSLCFCDLHLNRFFRYIKHKIGRKRFSEIFRKEYATNDEIEFRRLWYEFKRENILKVASAIEKTIHDIDDSIQIGWCVSAKRFNDLSGRKAEEILDVFNTQKAPTFTRLPGEYYTAIAPDMSRSMGWHHYYNGIINKDLVRVAEVTAVQACCFKDAAHVREEVMLHQALGINKVHFAWTEDFEYFNIWDLIKEKGYQIKNTQDNISLKGITVVSFENQAHWFSLDQVLNCEGIYGYQVMGLMGIPVKMSNRIEGDIVLLCGYQPHDKAKEVEEFLRMGGMLLMDYPAALSMKNSKFMKGLAIKNGEYLDSLCSEKIIDGGIEDFGISNFPLRSVGKIRKTKNSGWKIETLLYDINCKKCGIGCISNGNIMVFSYDFSKVEKRLVSNFYKGNVLRFLKMSKENKPLRLEGPLYIQLFLYAADNGEGIVIANYNAYPVKVKVMADEEIKIDNIEIDGLGIKVIEQKTTS